MSISLKNRSLISISDYTPEEICHVLDIAEDFEKNPHQNLLNGRIIASLFFEPSTRTRLSFETAIQLLGGNVIGFSSTAGTSIQKGESLADTITMVASYADLIYSIRKTQGTLENLEITLVGDLKYGRTVHSLVEAMCHFNAKFNLVSPVELKLPSVVKQHIKDRNLEYHQYTELEDAIPHSDIIYMTRIQRERFPDPEEYEKVKNSYVLRNAMLDASKPNCRILHPLPRVNEIHVDVDANPKAYYFQQAQNGVYARQALIASILGLK